MEHIGSLEFGIFQVLLIKFFYITAVYLLEHKQLELIKSINNVENWWNNDTSLQDGKTMEMFNSFKTIVSELIERLKNPLEMEIN